MGVAVGSGVGVAVGSVVGVALVVAATAGVWPAGDPQATATISISTIRAAISADRGRLRRMGGSPITRGGMRSLGTTSSGRLPTGHRFLLYLHPMDSVLCLVEFGVDLPGEIYRKKDQLQ